MVLIKKEMEMSDTFRKEYKPLDAETKDTMLVLKSIAENLEKEFDLIESTLKIDKRCLNIARTNLEQTIMWAIKAIT